MGNRSGCIPTLNGHPRDGGDPVIQIHRALCLVFLLDSCLHRSDGMCVLFEED